MWSNSPFWNPGNGEFSALGLHRYKIGECRGCCIPMTYSKCDVIQAQVPLSSCLASMAIAQSPSLKLCLTWRTSSRWDTLSSYMQFDSYIVTGRQHRRRTMWQDPIHLPPISTSIPLYGSLCMQCSSTAPQPASSSLTFTFHHFRTPTNQAIFRIALVCKYFRSYLDNIEFMEIHTAKLQFAAAKRGSSSSKWIISRPQRTLRRVHHWWKRHVFQQISSYEIDLVRNFI